MEKVIEDGNICKRIKGHEKTSSYNIINCMFIIDTEWVTKGGKLVPQSNEDLRQAHIQMRLTEFEMPPMQDVLIIGKMAPIGPEAAKRMADILSPNQYESVRVDHAHIEAIIIRKSLLSMMQQEKLIGLILEDAEKIINEKMIIKIQIQITMEVHKSVEL